MSCLNDIRPKHVAKYLLCHSFTAIPKHAENLVYTVLVKKLVFTWELNLIDTRKHSSLCHWSNKAMRFQDMTSIYVKCKDFSVDNWTILCMLLAYWSNNNNDYETTSIFHGEILCLFININRVFRGFRIEVQRIESKSS